MFWYHFVGRPIRCKLLVYLGKKRSWNQKKMLQVCFGGILIGLSSDIIGSILFAGNLHYDYNWWRCPVFLSNYSVFVYLKVVDSINFTDNRPYCTMLNCHWANSSLPDNGKWTWSRVALRTRNEFGESFVAFLLSIILAVYFINCHKVQFIALYRA